MRDNSEGFPEIVDAYERDGLFFGVIPGDPTHRICGMSSALNKKDMRPFVVSCNFVPSTTYPD
jgi:hypothetical protein